MDEAQFRSGELFGAWQLVALDAIKPNGEATTGWLGAKPTGLLVYDRSGYMSVQIMRGPREASSQDQEKQHASHPEYYAYFGIFKINENAQTIVHHVQGSLLLDEIGVDYRQNFALSQDQLMLLTARHLVYGEERRNRIVWRLLKKSL